MKLDFLKEKIKAFRKASHAWKLLFVIVPLLAPLKAHAIAPVIIAAGSGILGFLGGAVKELFGAGAEAAASLGVLAVSVGIIAYIAFSIAKFLVWAAAMTFNWAMETMVFGFSQIFGNSEGMLLAWSTLRDLGNILLLFGFITIGMRMILNVGHHSASKTLPQLIIFAVLINFSLFSAQAVVDVSNGLTYGLYNQSASAEACKGTSDSGMTECQLNNGVAGQILNQLNVMSVVSGASGFNVDLTGDVAGYFSNPVGMTINFIALAILLSIAAVVLFAGTFLLITRGVTLAFLMVLSPIGFAGMAIPALNDMANKWWTSLINNALFAPVFLILLFVGLRLSDGLKNLIQVDGGLMTAVTNGSSLAAGPFFLFLLVIGFLIAALMIGKQFSIAGAGFAVNAASSLTYGTMTRGTNLAGGIVALNARRIIEGNPNLAKRKGLQVLTNRFLKPLEQANLDLRRAGVGSALRAGGVSSGANAAEHATLGDMRHMYDDAASGKESKKLEKEFNKRVAVRTLETAIHDGNLDKDPDSKKLISGMNVKDLASLHAMQDINPDSKGSQQAAQTISSEQFAGLMKEEGYDGKSNLVKARFKELENATTVAQARAAMDRFSKTDFEHMPDSVLRKQNTLLALSDTQRGYIEGSDKFTAEQKAEVKGSTDAKIFEAELAAAPTAIRKAMVANRINSMDLDQVAKLSVETLKRDDVTRHFTTSMLARIQAGGKLRNKQDIQDVVASINRSNKKVADHIRDKKSPAYQFWN